MATCVTTSCVPISGTELTGSASSSSQQVMIDEDFLVRIRIRDEQIRSLTSNYNKSQISRCLFGRPDPADTRQMLQENLDFEIQRFVDLFGTDPVSLVIKFTEAHKLPSESICAGNSSRRKPKSPYARKAQSNDYCSFRKSPSSRNKSFSEERDYPLMPSDVARNLNMQINNLDIMSCDSSNNNNNSEKKNHNNNNEDKNI